MDLLGVEPTLVDLDQVSSVPAASAAPASPPGRASWSDLLLCQLANLRPGRPLWRPLLVWVAALRLALTAPRLALLMLIRPLLILPCPLLLLTPGLVILAYSRL